jgi:hypothetical protein
MPGTHPDGVDFPEVGRRIVQARFVPVDTVAVRRGLVIVRVPEVVTVQARLAEVLPLLQAVILGRTHRPLLLSVRLYGLTPPPVTRLSFTITTTLAGAVGSVGVGFGLEC